MRIPPGKSSINYDIKVVCRQTDPYDVRLQGIRPSSCPGCQNCLVEAPQKGYYPYKFTCCIDLKMPMADVEDEKTGLELDKIELPKFAFPKAKDAPERPLSASRSPGANSGRKHSLPFKLLLVGAALGLGAIMFLFWEHAAIKLPIPMGFKRSTSTERYENIGPVTSNIGSGHVKLDVDLGYRDPGAQHTIRNMKSAIKDRILLAMGTQEAEKMVMKRDLKGLVNYLKDEINGNVLAKTPIEHVYLSDFKVY